MANLKVSTLSTQYVHVPVSVTVNGVDYDPTPDSVQMAFTTSSSIEPQSEDWHGATWETDDGIHYVKTLIGPDQTSPFILAPQSYTVWVKITDDPEVPVIIASNHLVIF